MVDLIVYLISFTTLDLERQDFNSSSCKIYITAGSVLVAHKEFVAGGLFLIPIGWNGRQSQAGQAGPTLR